jgi:hypothetical protein
MKRSIRPSVPADAPAIAALFAEMGLQPNARPEDLSWKYWQARADWPHPRSYVMTSDDAIVAHAALVPGAILSGNHRAATGHVIDWAARRGQVGAGTALMKHIGQQVGSLLAVGGSEETLRILPHLGFRAAGSVTAYVRPLHPERILGAVAPGWKVLPRLARNAWWKLSAPRPPLRGWRARAVAADDLIAAVAVLPTPAAGGAVLERSAGLFRYLLECKIVPVTLHLVENAGGAGGYFMLAATPGQVRIIDCWMRSPDPADWSAMLECAVTQARADPQAAEVAIWAGTSLLSEAVRACGFRARLTQAVLMRHWAESAAQTGPVDVHMIDSDAAYFHEDRKAFLA